MSKFRSRLASARASREQQSASKPQSIPLFQRQIGRGAAAAGAGMSAERAAIREANARMLALYLMFVLVRESRVLVVGFCSGTRCGVFVELY